MRSIDILVRCPLTPGNPQGITHCYACGFYVFRAKNMVACRQDDNTGDEMKLEKELRIMNTSIEMLQNELYELKKEVNDIKEYREEYKETPRIKQYQSLGFEQVQM